MYVIPTVATATLVERAMVARAWAGGWVVVSPTRRVTVLDTQLRTRATHVADAPPDDVAVSIDGNHVIIASAIGLHSVGSVTWHVPGRAHTCCMIDHATMWTVMRIDGAHLELAVRGVADGRVLRSIVVDDVHGDADVLLCVHPAPRTTVVWIVAGQSGRNSVLAVDDGTAITCTPVPPSDALPPVFSPTGDAYLVGRTDALELRAWPGGALLDDCTWGRDDALDDLASLGHDPDPSGSQVDYLPGGFGCWSSSNGRLYLLDLAGMHVVDELTIAGHPLNTVHELYPRVLPVDEPVPCTDFQYAVRGPGETMLSVHRNTQLVVTHLRAWSRTP